MTSSVSSVSSVGNGATKPSGSRPQNIDEIVDALDAVVKRAIADNDRVGYFAVLYRRVTATVREAIRAGEFLDGPRMDRLDVAFGNRYLDALEAYRTNQAVTACWRVAFDACKSAEPMILQHMYLGLAAHLLLDLGIGAAETSPGQRIFDLRNDFDHVNEIVGRLMRTVDERVGRLSPWIGALDRIGGVPYATSNRVAIYFAREMAWRWGLELAMLDERQRQVRIATRDAMATRVSKLLANPPVVFGGAITKLIRLRERHDVAYNIRVLGE